MKSGLYQLVLKVVEILPQLLKNQDKRKERKKEGRKGKKLKLCTWDFCHFSTFSSKCHFQLRIRLFNWFLVYIYVQICIYMYIYIYIYEIHAYVCCMCNILLEIKDNFYIDFCMWNLFLMSSLLFTSSWSLIYRSIFHGKREHCPFGGGVAPRKNLFLSIGTDRLFNPFQ